MRELSLPVAIQTSSSVKPFFCILFYTHTHPFSFFFLFFYRVTSHYIITITFHFTHVERLFSYFIMYIRLHTLMHTHISYFIGTRREERKKTAFLFIKFSCWWIFLYTIFVLRFFIIKIIVFAVVVLILSFYQQKTAF